MALSQLLRRSFRQAEELVEELPSLDPRLGLEVGGWGLRLGLETGFGLGMVYRPS